MFACIKYYEDKVRSWGVEETSLGKCTKVDAVARNAWCVYMCLGDILLAF